MKLYKSKSGKSCLVIGGGPSIDTINLGEAILGVDDVLTVNDFWKTKYAKEIIPTFYALSDYDSFTIQNGAIDFAEVGFRDYLTYSKAQLFLPHTLAKYRGLEHYSPIYFNDRERTLLNRNIEPHKARSYTSVTLYKLLALSVAFDYREIHVIGLDNTEFKNYRGDGNNKLFNGDYDLKNVFVSDLAGRMQSYAHLFGDLNRFPKDRIVNLHKESLITTFKKAL